MTDAKSSPQQRSRQRPTMTDVARIAGVSQSSVSLVLNQMSGARIAESTRSRVIEAARQIGYHLPGTRRREPSAALSHNTIAYLVDEISTSPHPVVTLDGIRDAAWEAGFVVSAYVTRSNAELEAATFDVIRRNSEVIGVIYSTIFTRAVAPPSILDGLPTVLLNCYCETRKYPTVKPAEVSGACTAMEFLIGKGHRQIAFINGEPWMDASIDRLQGYKDSLQAAGISFDAAIVRDGDWLPLSGYALARELLALSPRPTALFCANDLMAAGAIDAAAELGLDVPGQVSIMGYDDQELSRYTNPPLTTVVLPNYEMGKRAAELLIETSLRGSDTLPGIIEIAGPLVERLSVAQPGRNLKSPR